MSRLARYQPPAIPPGVLVGLVILFALLSLARGLDYALNGDVAQSLVVLNALGDLRIWGALIAAAAAGVLAAYAVQRHFLIWCSHVVMAGIQLCIAVTIAQTILELDIGGWANFAAPAGSFAWHLLLLTLTRPFPRPDSSRRSGHGT